MFIKSNSFKALLVLVIIAISVACSPPKTEVEPEKELLICDQEELYRVRQACRKTPSKNSDTLNSYTTLKLLKNSLLAIPFPRATAKDDLNIMNRSPKFKRFEFEFKSPHWYLILQAENDFLGTLSGSVLLTFAGEENKPKAHLHHYEIAILSELNP